RRRPRARASRCRARHRARAGEAAAVMTVDAPRHPTAADAFSGDPDLVALARTGTVHFVGIAGAGMSALAEYLLRAGGSVSGCDARPGETGAHLATLGASVQ